ncbi:methyl-accepting chemotaxis protein [Texcoconibacillus texcoconensis]|uniref:Methyl-accepting chemotaxis protein n=1 Tax=Texcoconibacillus texcoconensis TaxID=1095777 RepID=A0A840QS73_9BACI|nr:HAMP domain-containing methyl-accepting chemotaxis protein [Texcoconibacillus texcoconensis]MBB5174356.1 methyl-accepting chemotaxis protein [Texcoconibacillus texcoconensis]
MNLPSFIRSIKFRFIVSIIIVLLLNTSITNGILVGIETLGISFNETVGLWVNNMTNVLLTTAIVYFLLEYFILRPIRKIQKKIQQFEDGDTTVRITMDKNDEISSLGRQVNHFFENIDRLETSREHQLEVMEREAKSINERIDQLTSGIDQTEEMSNAISSHSQNALATFEETTSVSDSLNDGMEYISSTLSHLNQSLQTMTENANIGKEHITDVTSSIQTVSSRSNDMSESLHKLSKDMNSINDIVALINDISEQTNLLALNASIEAARAGEHGKGFEVVANEVRKLAERSVEATQQISTTVSSILNDVELNVSKAKDGAETIDSSIEKIEDMSEQFENIIQNVFTNTQAIEDISSNIHSMTDSSKEIASAMQTETASTEKMVDQLVEMNRWIENQSSELDNIRDSVSQLHDSFHSLDDENIKSETH